MTDKVQQFMKNVQQGKQPLVGSPVLEGKAKPDKQSSLLSPLPSSTGAVSTQASFTPLMQNDENFVHLWQQILHIASTSAAPNLVLTKIAAMVGAAFQVEACLIGVGRETVCWMSDLYPEPTASLHSSESLYAELFNNLTPVNISDADAIAAKADLYSSITQWITLWRSTQVSRAALAPDKALEIRAILGTPIQFQETTIGILSLLRSQPYEWAETELQKLQWLSQQLAIVLSQLQLRQQLHQQMQYQAVVNQLTMAVRNSSDLQEILQLAITGTAQALQVPRGILLRLKYWEPLFRNRVQEQGSKVRASVACEWLSDTLASNFARPIASVLNQSFWISECTLCQYALVHPGRPIAVSNPQQLPKSNEIGSIAPIFNLEEFPALLLAPLESQGTILGFLAFQQKYPYEWKAEEIELVELVSAQVSTAMIQTETLRQVQGLVDKRTAELQQSLSIQAKLYERTRQQVDQLRHLNQLKDEFLSTVSHELRTPLTSMTMAIRMLRQIGIASDRSDRYLDILEQQCAQETSLINDLLALQELESKQVAIQLEEIDLKNLLTELVELFNQKWAAKGLDLDLNVPKMPLKLHSDRDSLNRILLELLTNAGKYSEPNSQIQLTVTHQIDHPVSIITISLCNIGSGISPADLPHIFEKFRRSQGATQNAIQGTGLGLALVQSLVQLLNGTITVSSYPIGATSSHETCFTLILPQSLNNSHS